MANYECTIRTNYFHVTDEEAFKALMCRVYGTGRPVNVFTNTDANGVTVFGFGTYGAIAGLKNAQCDDDDEFDESAYDEFIDELKKLIAPDDACIIFEVGYENLRYLTGAAYIITNNEERFINIRDVAIKTASLMLQNPNFSTKCEY
jgi:hypothetical protein